jgi:hypothetical protein
MVPELIQCLLATLGLLSLLEPLRVVRAERWGQRAGIVDAALVPEPLIDSVD